ncbi:MAG: hypothetical protein U0941_26100 [Planctomycetaceae bacterium]
MDVASKGCSGSGDADPHPASSNSSSLGGDAEWGTLSIRIDSVTESSTTFSYPGCYALSKLAEEIMLEQYTISELNGCLRAWIMEKDDKYALSFGEDVLGAAMA